MKNTQYCLFSFCLLLSLCVILFAQDATSQYVQSMEEAAALGPKNKAYIEAFHQLQESAKTLRAMKIEYQDARPERRVEIDAQYDNLYKQGLEQHKKSIELALEALIEAPNRNPWVINLLYSRVGYEFDREHYEEVVRIFKHLSRSGIAQGTERYYAFAGIAAMLSMQYEEAEAWLKKARESGELEKLLMSWAQSSEGSDLIREVPRQLRAMADIKEAWAKEQVIRKAEAEAGAQDPAKKLPRVEFITSKGRIVLELFENEAPNTVANFIRLVESGFYNDTLFHRVKPLFMAQGGEGRGVNFTLNDECGNRFPQYRKHFRGSISMANTGRPNTNSSQFFLTFVPTDYLDGKHTVFGRVVEGIEVLSDIQRYDPADKQAMIPELDKIIEAKVLNKRNHAYDVKRNAGR